jgi:Phosphoesterase family
MTDDRISRRRVLGGCRGGGRLRVRGRRVGGGPRGRHIPGWLPGANGVQAGLTFEDHEGVSHSTWHLDTFQGLQYGDPDHSYDDGRTQLNRGQCDGWLKAGTDDIFPIGYYKASDLEFYSQAAPYWTLCDNFHSSPAKGTAPPATSGVASSTTSCRAGDMTTIRPTHCGASACHQPGPDAAVPQDPDLTAPQWVVPPADTILAKANPNGSSEHEQDWLRGGELAASLGYQVDV